VADHLPGVGDRHPHGPGVAVAVEHLLGVLGFGEQPCDLPTIAGERFDAHVVVRHRTILAVDTGRRGATRPGGISWRIPA
jgi:hypothetical protein